MSNDHLSELRHSAVDEPTNGNGHDTDDGPLDPSVFFGLFDDLADDDPADDDPADDDLADGDPVGGIAADPGPELDDGFRLKDDVELGDGFRLEPELDLINKDAENDVLNGTEIDASPTVDWWSPPPTETPSNDPVEAEAERFVASPPPIRHPDDRAAERGLVDDTGPTDFLEINGPPNVPFTFAEEPPAVPPPTTFPTIEQRQDRGRPGGGGTLAKAALAAIAVGLLGGLVVAFVLSLRSPDTTVEEAIAGSDAGQSDGSTAVEVQPTDLGGFIEAGIVPAREVLADHFSTGLPAVVATRADLTSLRFEPGTTELAEPGTAVVAELGAALRGQPTVPVTITVRTYSEPTAAANLTLSADQADALTMALVAAGADSTQVRARGLGATPLSRAQPVPNFVVLDPGFGERRLDEVLGRQSPFAFGVPATATDDVWPLRLDGLAPLGEITEAVTVHADAKLGVAGYSFFPPSEAAIRSEAGTAAGELTNFLVDVYAIDAGRISAITPGSAVFVPTVEHGNHIWIQAGPAAQGAFDVAAIDPTGITFETGSADLDPAGQTTARELAGVLTTGGATIVVDVRSYDAADDAANRALSEARRDALARALIAEGVAPEQLRMFASGASSYFTQEDGPTLTITVAP